MVSVTTEQIWQTVENHLFAVLGMVSAKGEARTVGINYTVRDRKLYIATDKGTWKARHISQNPHVSLTVTIPKRIPFMPWVKIPAATITFSGLAKLVPVDETDPAILKALLRGMVVDEELRADMIVIVVEPAGDFITYGVGIPLLQMRDPDKALGRVAVLAG